MLMQTQKQKQDASETSLLVNSHMMVCILAQVLEVCVAKSCSYGAGLEFG